MAVVLFDGLCNLCNGSVQFIIARDRRARFKFASLQSAAAVRLLSGTATPASLDTVVLVEDGRVYARSDAALRIARGLGFPWALAWIFVLVPRVLRDLLYDAVARNRYRWFGRRDVCMVPSPALRDRFLVD